MIKRICHLTVAHKATDGRIFEKECQSLRKEGYDVSIVAPNIADCVLEDIKIFGVPLSMNPLLRLLSGARKIYKKGLELDADIYHFHDIELFKYGILLKRKGKKVIFDSHEDWIGYAKEISWLPRVVKNLLAYSIKRIYKKYLAEFDVVVTVSPHIVDILKKYTIKVKMITNYPIIDFLNLPQTSFEEYISRDNNLCYAGTVYSLSNQVTIIRSMQEVDGHYLIIGGVTEKYKNELLFFDQQNKVQFIKAVPKQKLIDYYNTCIGGIVLFDYSPNCGGKRGTMGNNKIFEYMMMGLPFICTDFDCWREMIVDKYNCGICVTPGKVKEVEDAIKKLLNDKDLAYRLGKNGQRAVIEEFNWNTQEKLLLDLYKDLC